MNLHSSMVRFEPKTTRRICESRAYHLHSSMVRFELMNGAVVSSALHDLHSSMVRFERSLVIVRL